MLWRGILVVADGPVMAAVAEEAEAAAGLGAESSSRSRFSFSGFSCRKLCIICKKRVRERAREREREKGLGLAGERKSERVRAEMAVTSEFQTKLGEASHTRACVELSVEREKKTWPR